MVPQSLITLLLPILALGAPQHWVTKTSTVTDTPVATSSSSSYEVLPTSSPSGTPSSGNGRVVFKNSCTYDVQVDAVPASGCSSAGSGTVAAGSTWEDTLTDCSTGNTALKVYKDGGNAPMQFEYGLVAGNVWYDMSFINCLSGASDFSQCAGAGWSMGSIGSCPTYACSGGEECCTQGYCDPTASAVKVAPNAGCGAFQGYAVQELGVSIEICAS